ncbi:MAG: hypothetical protein ACFFFG_06560 [Candidatus Thorarchaeota archaeon]
MNNESILKLLQLICAGKGVDINISRLAVNLKKHRSTIKSRVDQLFELRIIEKPSYPLKWLLDEYPLLVVSKDKFYRDQKTKTFIEQDPHILAGFFFQEEVYNTLTIHFHANLYAYQTWSDNILAGGKLIKEEDRYPPDALLFSTKRILKFDPEAPMRIIERGFKKGHVQEIGDLQLDPLYIRILKALLNGNAIRTNENFLARILNVNRNTITRQIRTLLQKGIISKPVSRFPLVFVPPKYMLIFSLFEIKTRCKDVEGFINRDPRIPLLIKANVERYNYFIVSVFRTVEDHLMWQERYTQNFSTCIEAIKNTYLSPAMSFSIPHASVSLELLKNKIELYQQANQKGNW